MFKSKSKRGELCGAKIYQPILLYKNHNNLSKRWWWFQFCFGLPKVMVLIAVVNLILSLCNTLKWIEYRLIKISWNSYRLKCLNCSSYSLVIIHFRINYTIEYLNRNIIIYVLYLYIYMCVYCSINNKIINRVSRFGMKNAISNKNV